jgi:uncharacterized membrane protein YhiD involved in acid resistance
MLRSNHSFHLDWTGTILKLNEQREIQGLTTAAGLWMTAAIVVACVSVVLVWQ